MKLYGTNIMSESYLITLQTMSVLGVTVPAWPDLLYYLGCLSAARLACYTLSELRAGCAAFLLPALASLTGSQDWSTRLGSSQQCTGAPCSCAGSAAGAW